MSIPKLRTTTGLIVLTLAVLLTACGSDDTAAQPQAETVEISVAQFQFQPGTIEVPVGTTVTWNNSDRILHTVTAGTPDNPTPEIFDGLLDDAGSTFSFTFTEAGTFDYYCDIHPHMVGTITVVGA